MYFDIDLLFIKIDSYMSRLDPNTTHSVHKNKIQTLVAYVVLCFTSASKSGVVWKL